MSNGPQPIIVKNFKPTIVGSTMFRKIFRLKNDLDEAIDLTGAIVRIQFKTHPNGPAEITFSNEDGVAGMSLHNDPTTGVFYLDQIDNVTIKPYNYMYDIQVHLENGTRLNPMKGFAPFLSEVTTDENA